MDADSIARDVAAAPAEAISTAYVNAALLADTLLKRGLSEDQARDAHCVNFFVAREEGAVPADAPIDAVLQLSPALAAAHARFAHLDERRRVLAAITIVLAAIEAALPTAHTEPATEPANAPVGKKRARAPAKPRTNKRAEPAPVEAAQPPPAIDTAEPPAAPANPESTLASQEAPQQSSHIVAPPPSSRTLAPHFAETGLARLSQPLMRRAHAAVDTVDALKAASADMLQCLDAFERARQHLAAARAHCRAELADAERTRDEVERAASFDAMRNINNERLTFECEMFVEDPDELDETYILSLDHESGTCAVVTTVGPLAHGRWAQRNEPRRNTPRASPTGKGFFSPSAPPSHAWYSELTEDLTSFKHPLAHHSAPSAPSCVALVSAKYVRSLLPSFGDDGPAHERACLDVAYATLRASIMLACTRPEASELHTLACQDYLSGQPFLVAYNAQAVELCFSERALAKVVFE